MPAPVLPLDCKLDISSKKSTTDRLVIANFGDGYSQIAPDGLYPSVDKWSLTYKPLTGSELTTVESFLGSVGVQTWFTWTPRGETSSKKWRIDTGSLKTTLVNTSIKLISFNITQQFDNGL